MNRTARDEFIQMFAADGTVLLHPDRQPARYRPLRAVQSFQNLMKDKEDTSQVFKIFESLPSKDFMPRVRDLALSERGEFLRANEPALPEILDDHAALRRTPKGSLAHAYCDFMEAEGLSAAGLVAESERAGRPRCHVLFVRRRRLMHEREQGGLGRYDVAPLRFQAVEKRLSPLIHVGDVRDAACRDQQAHIFQIFIDVLEHDARARSGEPWNMLGPFGDQRHD